LGGFVWLSALGALFYFALHFFKCAYFGLLRADFLVSPACFPITIIPGLHFGKTLPLALGWLFFFFPSGLGVPVFGVFQASQSLSF
jgi:hypothetical protein